MKEKFEKEYNISGKGATFEKKKDANRYLEDERKETIKPIEGEYKKTVEELKTIEYINKYLNKELKELEIKEKVEIRPEQIHLLPKDIYNRSTGISSKEKLRAFYYGFGQVIYIDKDYYKSRLSLYKAIFHESIHAASFLKFHLKKEEKNPTLYRSGYNAIAQYSTDQEHFCGLNEMIVDQIANNTLTKYKKKFKKSLKITPKEKRQKVGYYPFYILDTILSKVAKKNKENKKDVWNRFKKGLFTGEMMQLREVEKTFGKGSLRMLAALESGTKKEFDDNGYEKILKYFETNNKKKKQKIADQVLTKREKAKYNKQRKQ